MRRRRILATMPALLAGCLGADGGGTPETSTARRTTRTTTTTSEQPYDLIAADPASMTRDEVRQRLSDRACAALSELPTTCPSDDARLRVSVSPTVGELSGDTVEFTVENPTDEQFVTNHYGWVLRKWDGSQWQRLAPLAIPGPLDRILPGESHTYRITPVDRKVVHSQHDYVAASDVTLGGLGPGVYGFSTDGHFESAPDAERAAAAVFGFAGEGPAIRPTDAVSYVERDGSKLVVRADAPADKRAELVVSLVDGAPDARLLPEHVHQLAALRNTLPYAATDGVESIRYVGRVGDVDLVDSYLSVVTSDDATHYGFRNLVFEVSVEGG